MCLRSCETLLVILVSAGTVAAADPAWYGVALPEARAAAIAARAETADIDFWDVPTATRPTGDGLAPQPEMAGERILSDIRELVAIALRDRRINGVVWGRMIGEPAEAATHEFMVKSFREAGLEDVHTETFDLRDGHAFTRVELRLLGDEAHGAGTRDHVITRMTTVGSTAWRVQSGLEGELVWVGYGGRADLIGRDVKGKIVVVKSTLTPSPASHTAYGVLRGLTEAGAAGAIIIMNVPRELQLHPLFWGDRGPLPTFVVDGLTGGFLEELIVRARAPIRVRASSQAEPATGRTSANVFGLVPGASDEYVLVTAHTDSFFQGALDNGSGLGCMLALARHFARPGAPTPERNILFVATSGHHALSPGMLQLLTQKREILEKAAFVVNMDHVGGTLMPAPTGPEAMTNVEYPLNVAVTNRSPALISIVKQAVVDHGIAVSQATNHYAYGDPDRLMAAGVPVVNFISTPPYYHTSADVTENLSVSGLEHIAHAVAQIITETMALSWAEIEEGARPRPPLGPPDPGDVRFREGGEFNR